jgi:glutamate racemase
VYALPILLDAIAAYMGPGVRIIDSGLAIANRTRFVLAGADLLADHERPATLRFLTSADAREISPVVDLLLGEPAAVTHESVGEVIPSIAAV